MRKGIIDIIIRSLRIMEQFPIGGLTPQKLMSFINQAYSSFSRKILPVTKLENKHYLMEQFHGPTASFKYLALQLFPLFFEESIKNDATKYFILMATSGDTGSSVLSGFQDTKTPVIVLYPYGEIRFIF